MRPLALLAEGVAVLRGAGLPSPEADARALLAHALDVSPVGLVFVGQVGDDAQTLFRRLIQLRTQHHPVQHLTGVAYFRTVSLAVGPGVFIPRPETEGLVQLVIDWILERVRSHANMTKNASTTAGVAVANNPITVVDLGTGSGAIPKALATELANLGVAVQIHAVELSVQAYKYAEVNLEGLGVDLRLGDLADSFADMKGSADVVVSNPPYIPEGTSLPADVAGHDPDLALFSGQDGLNAIRSLSVAAARLLKHGGLLALEHDDSQSVSAPELLRACGEFTQVSSHCDLAGRRRYVTAVRA